MKTFKKISSLFLIALLGGIAALAINRYYSVKQYRWLSESQIRNPLPVKFVGLTSGVPENSVNFVTAAQTSVPAVVHIQTKVEMQGQPTYNSLLDYFYGNPQPNRIEGMVSGSGVIISGDGYIVTNNHVVAHAGKIIVTLSNRQSYTAKVIGKDPETDLALLKIDATGLPYLQYGNSDNLQVGQWVLAVGNPYNLTSTVTAGIVSAKGRNIDILPSDPMRKMYPIESYIQTDAAVNPGNSGGALVNTAGQLVGINSAIASNTGSFTGYSFAIPVNLVKKVVADLLKYGMVERAILGVSIHNVDADIARLAKLNSTAGIYVDSVMPGGAAAAAGMQTGDVILKVADQPVNNVADLEEQIGNYRPGDKVTITLSRNNKTIELPVVFRNVNGNTSLITAPVASAAANTTAINQLGASFTPLTKAQKERLHIDSGVQVAQLGQGKLSAVGVQNGFIITKLNHHRINSPDDIQKVIDKSSGGILVEGLYPNGMRAYYAFGM